LRPAGLVDGMGSKGKGRASAASTAPDAMDVEPPSDGASSSSTPPDHPTASVSATTSEGGEQEAVQAEPSEPPPEQQAQVPLPELQGRAEKMFSGATGAVVASGEGVAASAASLQLVDDVIRVIDKLPGELFDRDADHRPCGLLDRYSARGMLIADVLGSPLLPWVLAEPVGKAMQRLKGAMPGELVKARKAARRKGADVEAAAQAFLLAQVKLARPTAAEIAAAWRRLAKAEKGAAQPEPEPVLEPSPPEPVWPTPDDPDAALWQLSRYASIPGFRGTAGEDYEAEKGWHPAQAPCVPTDERPAHLFHSRAAAVAAAEAFHVERPRWDYNEETGEEYDVEEHEIYRVKYKHALRRLQLAFPDLDPRPLDLLDAHASRHRTRPCPCGRGVLARWPWVAHEARLGFCDCPMAAWELVNWRCEWIHVGAPDLPW